MKLTNEDVNKRLVGRNIQLNGNFIGYNEWCSFECLIPDCGYIWSTRAESVLKKNKPSGCRKCLARERAYSNEEIDQKLIDANKLIIRLDDYISINIKTRWQCQVCQYIWATTTGSIFTADSGCPNCYGNVKLTNKDIDYRLSIRSDSIIRLDDFINVDTNIHWQCGLNSCKYIWSSDPDNVLNKGTGCPKCAGILKITNENIDCKLKEENRKIIRLTNIENMRSNIDWQCEICQYIWSAVPYSILGAKTGCPKCAGRAPLTNEEVDFRLKKEDRKITRLGNIINNSENILWKCDVEGCGGIWSANAGNILFGYGCPLCKNKNEKSVYDVLTKNNIKFEYQKLIKYIDNQILQNLRVDFYLSYINYIIEYNGAQHYKPVIFGSISQEEANTNFEKQKIRDVYIQKFCDNNKIQLISIDGIKYFGTKLKIYLENEIIPEIKNLIAAQTA